MGDADHALDIHAQRHAGGGQEEEQRGDADGEGHPHIGRKQAQHDQGGRVFGHDGSGP